MNPKPLGRFETLVKRFTPRFGFFLIRLWQSPDQSTWKCQYGVSFGVMRDDIVLKEECHCSDHAEGGGEEVGRW